MNYQYQRLDANADDIRILILLPSGDPTTEIRCQLIHKSLKTNPQYAALSYTWSNPEPSESIYLAENSKIFQIAVGPNLFSALRQFRHTTEWRPLWIDALCINQSDTAERNRQVALMRSIYEKAACVLMWLGEEADDSNLAMNLLSKFGTIMTMPDDNGVETGKKSGGQTLADVCGEASFNQHWIALRRLFFRPYWSRVWIIQEVLLARLAVMCCGTCNIPWAFVASLVVTAPLLPHHIFSPAALETVLAGYFGLPQSLARIATDREEGEAMDLINGLILSRQRRATDTRDHIYGILSVINDTGIEPDYSKSMHVLYQDLVHHSIEKVKNLDILSACKRVNLESSSLPTWAPNWSLHVPELWYLLLNQRQSCHFQSDGLSAPKVSISDDGKALIVKGLYFDDIDIASPTDCSSSASRAFAELKLDWELWTSVSADEKESTYGDLKNQKQAFCATAVVGRDREGKKETFSEEGWQILWDEGLGWVDPSRFSEGEKVEREKQMQKLITRASDSITRGFDVGPRFFVTRQGYMGRGCRDLRKGDIICVFLGGRVPFILRPTTIDENYYLLGECCKYLSQLITSIL